MIKSNKQRRAELKSQKEKREAKAALKDKADRAAALRLYYPADATTHVNVDALPYNNSYTTPDFVKRGFYIDTPFTCKDCGKEEAWTATQQKWWYEVAKGDVSSHAIRCRPCRRRYREEQAEHRKRSEEGKVKKAVARGR
jgi:transcription elongation factor Elf1